MSFQTPKTTDLEIGERLVDLNALAASSSKLHPYHESPCCTINDHYVNRNPNTWNGEDVERWPEHLLAQMGPEVEQGSCGPAQTDAGNPEVCSLVARCKTPR
ncbi:hypothetical protein B0H14DRAFT_2637610 [Mycena olivaceomarginata]|nr:hypothetical protein B0H14DRAFT_2637610 [Mycena olivaceomarginata]